MELSPYLTFDGRCKEAFELYAECLGGKIEAMLTHGESPMAEQAPAAWRDKIMHARLVVGGWALMGSDSPPGPYEAPRGIDVTISVPDPGEAGRIFDTLAKGGVVRMPLQETFWALRFGMLIDRFGIPWMINCERPA